MAVKSSFTNMVLCLGTITLVCGALLSGAYVLTEDPISEAADGKTTQTLASVSPEFDKSELVERPDGSVYYITYSADKVAGYVFMTEATGFGGPISVMVGFRPDGTIENTAVLSQAETPGLGAKCVEPEFAGQFKGFDPSVKKLSVSKDGGDVDAITAATVTSRAYCAALGNAIAQFKKVAAEREGCGSDEYDESYTDGATGASVASGAAVAPVEDNQENGRESNE